MPNRVFLALLVASLAVAQSSCSTPLSIAIDAARTIEPTTVTEHLRFVAVGSIPDARMTEIASFVSKERPVVLKALGVTEMPKVSVVIWQDRNRFESAYGEDASNVRGFIDAENWEVHVFNTKRSPAKGAVHELVHLVSLSVNSTISHNPMWLWETTAIYASNRPPPPDLSTLACVTVEGVPTLKELNEHPTNIYRIGYYLGDFIVSTWGWRGLRTLIENNGGLEASLGISEDEFQKMWLAHLDDSHQLRDGARHRIC